MQTRKPKCILLIAAAVVMLVALPAQATPSISFSEATPIQPDQTVYSYTVSNSGFLTTGGFVTVYDFGSGGAISPTGLLADTSLFQFSRDVTNAGPPADPFHIDDPTLQNIRATYIGAVPIATANLGTFLIALNGSSRNGMLGSDGYDGQNGFTNGQVLGPANPIPSAVPEPVSLALLGTSLLCVHLVRYRCNRS